MVTSSRAAIAAYLHAMLRVFAPDSLPGKKLEEWLRLNLRPAGAESDPARPATVVDAPLDELWRRYADDLSRAAENVAEIRDPIGANFAALVTALGLDPEEAAAFRFVFEVNHDKAFEWLCDSLLETRAVDSLGLIALAIGSDPTAVWSRLNNGRLGRLQLVKFATNSGTDFTCFVHHRIVNALLPPNLGLADVERHLIGRPMLPQLEPDDFAHLEVERDFVLRLLGNAIDQCRPGTNILLHGRPGTGKTEFCKTIAAALNCNLFGVGEGDETGGEPSRGERLDALLLADRLAERRGRVVLLFDEMQDLLQREEVGPGRNRRNTGSKIFMNRLLEQNRVPILWTSNGIGAFDPAFIRRMDYVLEMKPLPLAARTRMLAAAARRGGIELDAAGAASLARRYRVAPGIIGGAIKAAALAGGGAEDVEFAAKALACAVEGHVPAPEAPCAPFRAELANADLDLAALERALTEPGAPRDFSMILFGPPGTGKSAFARHLAEAVDLEPMFRRASDLLSMWIGETEKRLAEAFAEAREDRRFLIIDEAEPFLWSRSGASRSWEVSMVDELLVQMENHVLPLACTSNLPEAIDPAAMRRFTLKVKFDFLAPRQAEAAYGHFFARPAPASLHELTCLTPSDFAAVTKRCRLLGREAPGDDRLLDMLAGEVAVKNLPTRKIGF